MQIFISYRKHDTFQSADLIKQALSDELKVKIFFDIEGEEANEQYNLTVQAALENSRVMLLLVGSRWHQHPEGLRINPIVQESDPVRQEIILAASAGVPIVVVYVDTNPYTPEECADFHPAVQDALTGPGAVIIQSSAQHQGLMALAELLSETHGFERKNARPAAGQALDFDPEWEANYLAGLMRTRSYLNAALPIDDRSFPLQDVYTPLNLNRPDDSSPEPVTWMSVLQTSLAALTGDAGSGKSTFLLYMTLQLAQYRQQQLNPKSTSPIDLDRAVTGNLGQVILPVLIDLARTQVSATAGLPSDPKGDLNQSEAWLRLIAFNLQLSLNQTEALLRRGGVVLLVDGLDEVTNPADREKVIEGLVKIQQAYNSPRASNGLVVSCRRAAWSGRGIFNSFAQFVIQPMGAATADAFLTTWCRAVWGSEAHNVLQRLQNTLRRSAGLAKVAQNPQMAAMLAFLEHGKEVPYQRALLYEEFIKRLIRTNQPDIKELLVALALEMQRSEHASGERLNALPYRRVTEFLGRQAADLASAGSFLLASIDESLFSKQNITAHIEEGKFKFEFAKHLAERAVGSELQEIYSNLGLDYGVIGHVKPDQYARDLVEEAWRKEIMLHLFEAIENVFDQGPLASVDEWRTRFGKIHSHTATPQQLTDAGSRLLKELNVQTGLLEVDEPRGLSKLNAFVRFKHRTFQEFLTARYFFSRYETERDNLLAQATTPAWAEVLAFCSGLLAEYRPDDLKDLLEQILQTPAENASATELAEWAPRIAAASVCVTELATYQVDANILEPVQKAQNLALRLLREPDEKIDLSTKLQIAEGFGAIHDPRLKDELRWVKIPGGTFMRGSVAEDAWPQEGPQAPITIGDFYIQRWPVTVKEFQLFLEDPKGYVDDRWWDREGVKWRQKLGRGGPKGWEQTSNIQNRPVTGVSWWEASAYCRWYDAQVIRSEKDGVPAGYTVRLPTEAQWEYAAHPDPDTLSGEVPLFPWGTEWTEQPPANYARSGLSVEGPTPVGLFWIGSGRRFDLWDLAGNASELCLDGFAPYESGPQTDPLNRDYTHGAVVRGGSFRSAGLDLRITARFGVCRDDQLDTAGFRCVAVPKATPDKE